MAESLPFPEDIGSAADAAREELQKARAELAALEASITELRQHIDGRRYELAAASATLERLGQLAESGPHDVEHPKDRHAEILESINDAFYALDVDFNFTYTNAKALEIWGRPGADIIGHNFWEEFPRARNSESGSMHLIAMRENRAMRYETFSPVLRSWIDVSIYPDRAGGLCVYFRDITHSKTTEAALRESESRLRFITDLVPDLLWCCGPEGHADWYNGRWLEYTGLSLTEALNLGWMETMHPEDRDAWAFAYQETLRQSSSLRQVHRMRRYDGSYRWFLVQVAIQKDAAGEMLRLYGTATDIHEQRTVLDALRESEAHLRVTLESATDYAIVSTNKGGIIDGWSAGAELIFGYPADEALGLSADILFTPEDRAAGVPDQEMSTARSRGWAADERWHIRRDGTRFYMSGVMRPIFNPDLRGYVKVARDMTEQQEAAERLRISEERLRIALKSAELGAWDWDIRNNLSVWNEQHYLMLGLSPSDRPTNREGILSHIHPEDQPAFSEALDHAVNYSGLLNIRFRILRADTGALRWMQAYGRVIETVGPGPGRMVGVLYDITETRTLEQQKDQFIAIASHELRTPVTAINSYAEVLRDMLAETGDEQSYQLVIKLDAQVERLARLVRDLLDVTRIREGRLELRLERFDLEYLLQETADEMSHSARIPVQLHTDGTKTITADRERIRQVIINLLSNAIRYSPAGSPVTVHLEQREAGAVICVRDFGAGLLPETRAQLFERYFRAGTREDNDYPGLGLGLYIAAEIVHRHEGQIWAENAAAGGARFCFTLPLR